MNTDQIDVHSITIAQSLIPDNVKFYLKSEAKKLNNHKLRRTISCRSDYLNIAFKYFPEIIPFLQQVFEYDEIQHLLIYFQYYPSYIQNMIFYK